MLEILNRCPVIMVSIIESLSVLVWQIVCFVHCVVLASSSNQ